MDASEYRYRRYHSVCECVWGLLRVAFYSDIKQSRGSEATLFVHERDRAFSELPLRQAEITIEVGRGET